MQRTHFFFNNKISLLKGGARYLWYQLGTTINKKRKKSTIRPKRQKLKYKMSLYIKAYELKCLIVAFLNAPIEFDLATVIGKLFHNLTALQ